jgi:rifampicin phosphotransferase
VNELHFLDQLTPDLDELVGGKAASLGRMARAGFPVPNGFILTTQFFIPNWQVVHSDLIATAYNQLGNCQVAVRSSANAEDGEEQSFAGQQETILGVQGIHDLVVAIQRCFESLHSDRASAYRRQNRVDDSSMSMAVIVQKLILADVAGVMFTQNPLEPQLDQLLIEASYGLGEAVVSGLVQPDRYIISRYNLTEIRSEMGRKTVRIDGTGQTVVHEKLQQQLCLNEDQVTQLAQLGLRVETFYLQPRDIEWALADGGIWLLQARPITANRSSIDIESLRQQEILKLRQISNGKLSVWSRTTLIESLAEPSPMTWSMMTKVLSANGATGKMYREFGFTPDPSLGNTTAYDLIGGRPYRNLCREPYLQSPTPMFGYPLEMYRDHPEKALQPKIDSKTRLQPRWRLLPEMWQGIRTSHRIEKAFNQFEVTYSSEVQLQVARILEDYQVFRRPTSNLDNNRLILLFNQLIEDFTAINCRLLQPTLLAQVGLDKIESILNNRVNPEQLPSKITDLMREIHTVADSDLLLCHVSQFCADADLVRFGHRGSNELELSQPRYEELGPIPSELTQPRPNTLNPKNAWLSIALEARIPRFLAMVHWPLIEKTRRYFGLRETAKSDFLRIYQLIRYALLEFDRRWALQGDIFEMTYLELQQYQQQPIPLTELKIRKRERKQRLKLEIPAVIHSENLDVIGRTLPVPEDAEVFRGITLSPGVVEGTVLSLRHPRSPSQDEQNFILLCPTSDPSWVPLFTHAKGLIMQTGGVLSHGAIVAREFDLPAVAGIDRIQEILKTGDRVRLDANQGIVSRLP